MSATTMVRYGLQRGVGMVETMVGIVIGLVVVLVIYNIFAFAEGYKRTAIGVGDAQVTGQFAAFALSRELASAGNGIAVGMSELAKCGGEPRLKPIPVLITDGGGPNSSDSFIAFYSNATRVVTPVLLTDAAVVPPVFRVFSPNGFAVNDWVIATDNVLNGNCFLTQVTKVSAPPGPGGEVDVTTAPAVPGPFINPANWRLVNLGQVVGSNPITFSRVQYTVDAVKRQLYSQNVNWQIGPQPVVPMA